MPSGSCLCGDIKISYSGEPKGKVSGVDKADIAIKLTHRQRPFATAAIAKRLLEAHSRITT